LDLICKQTWVKRVRGLGASYSHRNVVVNAKDNHLHGNITNPGVVENVWVIEWDFSGH
jgi:hypothetical protein